MESDQHNPGWINWICNNIISVCSQWAVWLDTTDNRILGNYISSGANGLRTLGAAQIVGNMIDNHYTGVGVQLQGVCTVCGNYLHQNSTGIKVAYEAPNLGMEQAPTITGNQFYNQVDDIFVHSGVKNGSITGNVFSRVEARITFEGGNTGWTVIGNSFHGDANFATKFVNAPVDATILCGGTLGTANTIPSLTVTSGARASGPALTVTPLGASNLGVVVQAPAAVSQPGGASSSAGLIQVGASNALWNALAVTSNAALAAAVRTDGRAFFASNVGVARAAPAYPLDVAGSARVGSSVTSTFIRTLGTAVGDGVHVCSVTSANAAMFAFRLHVVHGESGNNLAKVYDVVSGYNATNNAWQALRPVLQSAATNSNDIDVDIQHGTGGSMTLRLRRASAGVSTAGANVTCTLTLTENASETVSVSGASTTSTGLTAPSATHASTLLTSGRGGVLDVQAPVVLRSSPTSAASAAHGLCLTNTTGGARWFKLATVQEVQTKAKFRLQGLVHPSDFDAHSFDMTISSTNGGAGIDAPLVTWHSSGASRNILGASFDVVVVTEASDKVHLYAALANGCAASLSVLALQRNAGASGTATYYPASAAYAVAVNGAITQAEDASLSGALACFHVSAAARFLRLDAAGYLGISASNGAAPAAPLHVATSNAGGVSILAVGSVSSASDARLKRDVRVIDDALGRLARVQGYTFARAGTADDAPREAGVLAQEMRAALPEVVREDAEGMLSVAYGNVTALLIQAVKELQQRVDAALPMPGL